MRIDWFKHIDWKEVCRHQEVIREDRRTGERKLLAQEDSEDAKEAD